MLVVWQGMLQQSYHVVPDHHNHMKGFKKVFLSWNAQRMATKDTSKKRVYIQIEGHNYYEEKSRILYFLVKNLRNFKLTGDKWSGLPKKYFLVIEDLYSGSIKNRIGIREFGFRSHVKIQFRIDT